MPNIQHIFHMSSTQPVLWVLGIIIPPLLLLPPPFSPPWWVHFLCLLLMDVQSLVDLSVVKNLLSGVLVLSGLKFHDLLKDLSSVNGLASDLFRTAIP